MYTLATQPVFNNIEVCRWTVGGRTSLLTASSCLHCSILISSNVDLRYQGVKCRRSIGIRHCFLCRRTQAMPLVLALQLHISTEAPAFSRILRFNFLTHGPWNFLLSHPPTLRGRGGRRRTVPMPPIAPSRWRKFE